MPISQHLKYLHREHVLSLKLLSRFLSECRDPWWVFGSAAIALCGFNPFGVRDIDVLVSMRDTERLMKAHSLVNIADGGNSKMRSDVFLRAKLGSVPVEIMSNFMIQSQNGWKLLAPATRVEIDVEGASLFVPDVNEQIDILYALGRPKDLARARSLRLSL
ncbi:MAG: hypothetical protein AAFX02_05400 [Pseudomonadota bacterium]